MARISTQGTKHRHVLTFLSDMLLMVINCQGGNQKWTEFPELNELVAKQLHAEVPAKDAEIEEKNKMIAKVPSPCMI